MQGKSIFKKGIRSIFAWLLVIATMLPTFTAYAADDTCPYCGKNAAACEAELSAGMDNLSVNSTNWHFANNAVKEMQQALEEEQAKENPSASVIADLNADISKQEKIKKQAESANNRIRELLADHEVPVDYDAATGTTKIGGEDYSTYNKRSLYGDEENIQNYMDAGGDKESLGYSYNGASDAENGVDEYTKVTEIEVVVMKYLEGLSDEQAADFTQKLNDAKKEYQQAQQDLAEATEQYNSGKMSEAEYTKIKQEKERKMKEAHNQAEAARQEYGYDGGDAGSRYDPTTGGDPYSAFEWDCKISITVYGPGTVTGDGFTIDNTERSSTSHSLTVQSGQYYELDLIPADGAHIASVLINGINIPNAYTLSWNAIWEDMDVVITFKEGAGPNPITAKLTAAVSAGGHAIFKDSKGVENTVDSSASGVFFYNKGQTAEFSVVTDSGYRLSSVVVTYANGKSETLDRSGSYRIKMDQDCAITVQFEQIEYYTVTVNVSYEEGDYGDDWAEDLVSIRTSGETRSVDYANIWDVSWTSKTKNSDGTYKYVWTLEKGTQYEILFRSNGVCKPINLDSESVGGSEPQVKLSGGQLIGLDAPSDILHSSNYLSDGSMKLSLINSTGSDYCHTYNVTYGAYCLVRFEPNNGYMGLVPEISVVAGSLSRCFDTTDSAPHAYYNIALANSEVGTGYNPVSTTRSWKVLLVYTGKIGNKIYTCNTYILAPAFHDMSITSTVDELSSYYYTQNLDTDLKWWSGGCSLNIPAISNDYAIQPVYSPLVEVVYDLESKDTETYIYGELISSVAKIPDNMIMGSGTFLSPVLFPLDIELKATNGATIGEISYSHNTSADGCECVKGVNVGRSWYADVSDDPEQFVNQSIKRSVTDFVGTCTFDTWTPAVTYEFEATLEDAPANLGPYVYFSITNNTNRPVNSLLVSFFYTAKQDKPGLKIYLLSSFYPFVGARTTQESVVALGKEIEDILDRHPDAESPPYLAVNLEQLPLGISAAVTIKDEAGTSIGSSSTINGTIPRVVADISEFSDTYVNIVIDDAPTHSIKFNITGNGSVKCPSTVTTPGDVTSFCSTDSETWAAWTAGTGSKKFSFAPDSGYETIIKVWRIRCDGSNEIKELVFEGETASYSFADGYCYECDAMFVEEDTAFYNVTYSVGAGGQINISDITTPETIAGPTRESASAKTATASYVCDVENPILEFVGYDGWVVKDVLIDGLSMGPISTYRLSGPDDHTVEVSYTRPRVTVKIVRKNSATGTVSVFAGSNALSGNLGTAVLTLTSGEQVYNGSYGEAVFVNAVATVDDSSYVKEFKVNGVVYTKPELAIIELDKDYLVEITLEKDTSFHTVNLTLHGAGDIKVNGAKKLSSSSGQTATKELSIMGGSALDFTWATNGGEKLLWVKVNGEELEEYVVNSTGDSYYTVVVPEQYSVSSLTSDLSIEVYFGPDGTCPVTFAPGANGYMRWKVDGEKAWKTVKTQTTESISLGTTIVVEFPANSGYRLKQASYTWGSDSWEGNVGQLRFSINKTDSLTVRSKYTANPKVTVTINGQGSVAYENRTSNREANVTSSMTLQGIALNDTLAFTANPADGWKLASITAKYSIDNGVTWIPMSSNLANPYVIDSVCGNIRITFTFEELPELEKFPIYLTLKTVDHKGMEINEAGGFVTTGGETLRETTVVEVTEGSYRRFFAQPYDEYSLLSVTVNGRQISGSSFSVSNVHSGQSIEVVFMKNPPVERVNITVIQAENGSISPSGEFKVIKGTNETTFTFTANSGYMLESVLVNGVAVDPAQHAGGTYTLRNVSSDTTITAAFVPIPVETVTVTVIQTANGSISPDGNNDGVADGKIVVEKGSSVTFTFTPNAGYMLHGVTVGGTTVDPTQYAGGTYILSDITADTTISATFVTIPPVLYTVTFVVTDDYGRGINATVKQSLDSVILGTYSAGTHSLSIQAGSKLTIDPNLTENQITIGSTVVNNVDSYEITVTTDCTVYVKSGPPPVEYVNITVIQAANGSISPSGTIPVERGTNETTFTFTPNTGYMIGSVLVNGTAVDPVLYAGGTYTLKNVTADTTVSATFIVIPPVVYTVTLVVTDNYNTGLTAKVKQVLDSVELGTFSSGTHTLSIQAGTQLRIESSPAEYQVVLNSVAVAESTGYTHTVSGNCTIEVRSIANNYIIEASAGENGTINPSGANIVQEGGSLSFTATANSNYVISALTVNGVAIPAAVGQSSYTYGFTNVQANGTIHVTFTKASYSVSVSAGANGSVIVIADGVKLGTVSNGTQSFTVNYGAEVTYTVTPKTGYSISDVVVDGTSQGAITSGSLGSITSARTISAIFGINSYSISVSAGTGGSVTLKYADGTLIGTVSSGTSNSFVVNHGAEVTYTVTPNAGHNISAVKVDNVSKGTTSSGSLGTVTGAHSISATFDLRSLSISVTAGTGGSITLNYEDGTLIGTVTSGHSESFSVNYGTKVNYTITTNAGFTLSDVKVDGTSKGSISSGSFGTVTSPHSISADFGSNSSIGSIDPDLTDSEGNDLSSTTIKSGYGIFAYIDIESTAVSDMVVTVSYNFGQGDKMITLELVDGKYMFPVNADSPLNQRCLYIPVNTPDKAYTLTITVSGKKSDGTAITKSTTTTITVKGTMYDDNFTGDS